MSMAAASLFPMTVYDGFQPVGDYLKSRRERDAAHSNITKRKYNAYEAWMFATSGYIPGDLHQILGVTEEAYNKWRQKGQIVLPPENTLRFCLHMGIHPAYLVPGYFDKEKSYPESVINLMTQLLREKPKRQIADILKGQTISDADRKISIKAFSAELGRYLKLCDKHKNFKPYTSASIDKITRQKLGGFRLPGLEKTFNYAIGHHASDIEDALDLHEAHLVNLEKESETRNVDQTHLLAESRSRLEYLGTILHGDKRAGPAIDQIVKVLDQMSPDDRFEFWLNGQDDVIDDLNLGDNFDSIRNFPSLSADFELNSIVERCDPDQVKEEFLSELRNYYAYLEDFRVIKDRAKLHFNGLNQFQNWRYNIVTREQLIPQFRNYCMISPYLEKETEHARQKCLPDYSSKPSRNPA